MYSTRYSRQILIKLEFSRRILKKYSDIKFHKNASRGSRVISCGRTERLDEDNIRRLKTVTCRF